MARDPLVAKRERQLERLHEKVEAMEKKWAEDLRRAVEDEETRNALKSDFLRDLDRESRTRFSFNTDFKDDTDMPTGEEQDKKYWED